MNKIHENKSTWCVMETPNGLANKVFHTLGKKKKKKADQKSEGINIWAKCR